MSSPLLIPLFAFGLTALLHFVALKVFPLLGFLDFPEQYGILRGRLPYPTGILAILVFLVFFVFLFPWNLQNIGIALSILLLGTASFIDDRTPFPPFLRLGIQTIVAFIIFATGSRIYTITNPLELATDIPFLKLDTIDIPSQLSIFNYQLSIFPTPLPLWSGIFTIVWLLLTINAMNWFDGIPGQVSTLSTIGFFTLGFLSLSERVDQPELALLAFLLAGISLAGLLFDVPPPRVLMGDTGSMFFGLMLGVLTIYAGGKVATAFLVLGVPLTDSLLVVLQRILKGKSPFRGTLTGEHLHHRLLTKGWSPREVILLIASLGTLFGVTALFLSTLGKFFAAFFLFGTMLSLSWYTRPTTNRTPH